MANIKITDLSAYSDPESTDVLPIVDITNDATKKVSIADLMENAGAGAEATPGIAFDGDPDTGIYRPAANQLAFSTGGTQRILIDDSGVVTVAGDLTVNGTTTTVNSTTVTVDDKNIELGSVGTPTDTTADGGGITLKGATDKTLNWVNSTDSWTSSENVDLASGKTYKIAGTDVLSATALGSAVQISSDNIPSGTIVNDDVNASAAIAGTKIDPDFGSQTVETTGVFSAAGGAQGTPSITFTGDLNTGIYSPGADQVAISTGGSGRLFIDSSGSIGIGSTSVSSAVSLHISKGNTRGILLNNSSIGTTLTDGTYLTNTTDGSFTIFNQETSSGFNLRSDGHTTLVTSSQERLRITSDGKVGVGTSSPNKELEVAKNDRSAGAVIRLTNSAESSTWAANDLVGTLDFYTTDASAAGQKAAIKAIADTGSASSYPSRVALDFVTSTSNTPTTKMRITHDGKVGVGTTSPSFVLDVQAASANASIKSTTGTNLAYLNFNNTAGNSYVGLESSGGGNFATGTAAYALCLAHQGAYPICFATNNTERLRIDSSGRVGIGNSSPGSYNGSADDLVIGNHTGAHGVTICSQNNSSGYIMFADGTTNPQPYAGQITYDHTNNRLTFGTSDGSTALAIDAAQRVGIGTTSPGAKLEVAAASSQRHLRVVTHSSADSCLQSVYPADGNLRTVSLEGSNVDFYTGTTTTGTLKARIDSSGRLLVGTSSQTNSSLLTVEGNTGNNAGAGELTLQRGELATSITAGESLGHIYFGDNSANKFAEIAAWADAAAGSGDYPGRLVFSTTADNTSSPTERMRIRENGTILVNTGGVAPGSSTSGLEFHHSGYIFTSVNGAAAAYFNRNTNDGTIVELRQGNVGEGTISVSGTTVSYNGAHLARWSQLPGGVERTEILRGSVLSNIDEMCEWGEEENEQLNRMQVSNIEGDRNVSGVFQAWDDDDDTYTNDFYCAMTGDFVIRIGAGVTVERGDLLMSAGDGTAKPQDDDIIRSKTIAKVTSTNVSCTYDDGSYCVPCVLMAC